MPQLSRATLPKPIDLAFEPIVPRSLLHKPHLENVLLIGLAHDRQTAGRLPAPDGTQR